MSVIEVIGIYSYVEVAYCLERGIPELEVAGWNPACYTFHLENRSPKYFGIDTMGTKNVRENGGKKTEMFGPIAVRNRLATPYGRKVLGSLKQCMGGGGWLFAAKTQDFESSVLKKIFYDNSVNKMAWKIY